LYLKYIYIFIYKKIIYLMEIYLLLLKKKKKKKGVQKFYVKKKKKNFIYLFIYYHNKLNVNNCLLFKNFTKY